MTIHLPQVPSASKATLAQSLAERRSQRQYSGAAIDQPQLAQLLWAAQGRTGEQGQCTTPSAGAQYSMAVFVAVGRVTGVPAGAYRYHAAANALEPVLAGDVRERLCAAALDEQPWVAQAAAILVLAADLDAMQAHFHEQPPQGRRGERYAYLEAGAMAQNVCLQATALDLAAVLVGGFDDAAVGTILALADSQRPAALLCIGRP